MKSNIYELLDSILYWIQHPCFYMLFILSLFVYVQEDDHSGEKNGNFITRGYCWSLSPVDDEAAPRCGFFYWEMIVQRTSVIRCVPISPKLAIYFATFDPNTGRHPKFGILKYEMLGLDTHPYPDISGI